MARREVLVQLEDGLVGRLDEVARRLGVSRSELLRRAAEALLEADRIADADRKLVEAYTRTPQDPAIVEAAHRLAVQTWPEW